MDTRDYYKQEIGNILQKYQQKNINVADYYRTKTIESLMTIDNVDYLYKIYSFTISFC